MRHSFGKNLEQYRDIVIDEREMLRRGDINEAELTRLGGVLEWHLGKAAEMRDTTEKTQRKIYELQKQKQATMDRLHRRLDALDHPERHTEDGSSAGLRVCSEGGVYYVEEPNGPQHKITLGEIMTDGAWGVRYTLDPDSVPRSARKMYLVEETKRELQTLLDGQIILDETGSGHGGEGIKAAYLAKSEESGAEMLPAGLVAEKMVENFFKKLTYDADAPFEIRFADIYQDVTQKIDFIIHRKTHNRGIGVETSEKDDIGVQFTTRASGLEHKKEQVRRARKYLKQEDEVGDIMLVSVPLVRTKELFEKWNAKKLPGGPDKLWDVEIKRMVYEKVLKDILTPEEMEGNFREVAH